jgi:hypothetical protein
MEALSPSMQSLYVVRSELRGGDRRRRPTPMLCRYTILGGRRRTSRRAGERAGTYVDLHGSGLFLCAVAIIALNVLDAWFTLLFLSYGGRELNPMVESLLQHGGPWAFVVFKTLGIGVCVAFLTVTKNFRSAQIGMGIVLVGYAALLGWHIHLLEWVRG